MSKPMDDHKNLWNDRLFRKLIWQSVAGLIAIVAVVAVLALWLREPMTNIATWLIDIFGVFGIFLGVFLSDAFAFPIPPTTYIFLGVAAESPFLPLLIAASIASISGGTLAYFVGPYMQKVPFVSRRIEAFRSYGEEMFRRWGAWTILIAALTPVPFSVICWFAGIYKMRFRTYFSALMIRVPRLFVYYAIFIAGWTQSG